MKVITATLECVCMYRCISNIQNLWCRYIQKKKRDKTCKYLKNLSILDVWKVQFAHVIVMFEFHSVQSLL